MNLFLGDFTPAAANGQAVSCQQHARMTLSQLYPETEQDMQRTYSDYLPEEFMEPQGPQSLSCLHWVDQEMRSRCAQVFPQATQVEPFAGMLTHAKPMLDRSFPVKNLKSVFAVKIVRARK